MGVWKELRCALVCEAVLSGLCAGTNRGATSGGQQLACSLPRPCPGFGGWELLLHVPFNICCHHAEGKKTRKSFYLFMI